MLCTTLGYLKKETQFLMLHRIKKKNDINQDKWIGIGGKLEPGETILECMQRECLEETGLVWKDPVLKGIVTFNFYKTPDTSLFCEQMFLYTDGGWSGQLKDCDEGELVWVEKSRLKDLNLWKGDYIFLDLMEIRQDLFYLKLDYCGDDLVRAELDGSPLPLD